MKILTKEEVDVNKDVVLEVIKNGTVFIHPTDTIYGIGCNALDEEAVDKIREMKGRPESPFSVIAPSKDWVRKNCVLNKEAEKWLKKLPGPYTLILLLKSKISKGLENSLNFQNKAKDSIAENVAPGLGTLGVRIPDHWFSKIVGELNIPVVTTSSNKVGNDFMTSLENLDADIKSRIEFIVYEGEKHGRPSKIVDLTKEEVKVKER